MLLIQCLIAARNAGPSQRTASDLRGPARPGLVPAGNKHVLESLYMRLARHVPWFSLPSSGAGRMEDALGGDSVLRDVRGFLARLMAPTKAGTTPRVQGPIEARYTRSSSITADCLVRIPAERFPWSSFRSSWRQLRVPPIAMRADGGTERPPFSRGSGGGNFSVWAFHMEM